MKKTCETDVLQVKIKEIVMNIFCSKENFQTSQDKSYSDDLQKEDKGLVTSDPHSFPSNTCQQWE